MKMTTAAVMGLAVVAAAGLLGGCADESAPTRPRTTNIFTPTDKARDNAERREQEAPQRELPTSGKEFPGQSRVVPPAAAGEVILADTGEKSAGSREVALNGDNANPTASIYDKDYYPGPLPHLPANPGTVPMAGSTELPGTPWAVENSWGQGLVLENYPHRDWPETQANYVAANTKSNPVYFFNIQDRLPVPQNDGSYVGDHVGNFYELPWFVVQPAVLPVLMILQAPAQVVAGKLEQDPNMRDSMAKAKESPLLSPISWPWQQVTTQRLGSDPNYLGYLSAGGSIVPSPTPGVIKWEYPFIRAAYLNQDLTTQPAAPIEPTPGIVLPPSEPFPEAE